MLSTLILAVLLASNQSPSHARLDQIIAGDWCAGSKNAFHEEFSLGFDNGVRRFDSWLHQKPALAGTWEVHGRELIIRGEHGDRMDYKIVRASKKRLVLRNVLEKYNEIYVRPGRCRSFENPYTDPKFHGVPN